MNAQVRFLTAGLVAFLGWSGCRSSPEPGELFAEGERLRLAYEKRASEGAVDRYEQAMNAWAGSGDYRQAALAGQRSGATHEQLGSLERSRQEYARAATLARQAGDRLLESAILSDLGAAEARLAARAGDFDRAEKRCRSSLDLALEEGAPAERARALNCLGEVAYHHRLPDLALRFYEEAGRLWAGMGDPRGQAQTLLYQGDVHSEASRFDRAQDCYDRARALWTSLGDRRQLAITLVADARLRVRRGEYQSALNRFGEALELLQPMGDVVWEGSALTGTAMVYQDMGETRSAIEYLERALRLFEAAGLQSVAADALISLGEMSLTAGDDAAALSRFERALAIAEEQGTGHWRAKALRFIGVIHLFRRDPTTAREFLQRSLDAQPQAVSGDTRLRARTLADLGEGADLAGEHEAARKYFEEALAISRSAADRVAEARGLFGLARASFGLNDLPGARRSVEQSLDVVESLRTAIESRDLRASYFASVYGYHEFHIDVLMRMHADRPRDGLAAAAFEASERARARSLLDSLMDAGVDLRAGVDPALLDRERRLNQAFADWTERQRRLAGTDGDGDGRTLAREYRELQDRFDQVQAAIRRRSPRYADLVRPRPLSLQDVQRQVLDDRTVLLEYALGEEQSYLWAVSNRRHESYRLPPRADIERSARRLSQLLTARLAPSANERERRRHVEQADAVFRTEAARMSDMLLGPVAAMIAGRRLLVVADGALQYVPFAALPVPGRQGEPVPMIVNHEIVSLPSASVLAVLRRDTGGRPPPARTIAVLADPVFEPDDPRLQGRPAPAARLGGFPRLVATRQEAAAILAAAPRGTTLSATDFEASRATATGPRLADYRIVHFATHGVFDSESPELSGIVLSMFDEQGRPQDGFLRLRDIYRLELSADLVVLSACNSALGRDLRGEGLVGMVRGFMYAGAKRVVASLWKVDDEATGELMSRFYAEMFQRNRSPAAALREAQLSMLSQRRWQSPFYWAAFVLQGEGR